MLVDIPNLGNPDPKVSKAAALNIIEHVSKNQGELSYLVKRLVTGLESTKLQTRTGCYTTLTVLLALNKLGPLELYSFVKEALVTNKQSTKKERRLIYTARILTTGSVLKTIPGSKLLSDQLYQEFFKPAVEDLIDLSLKKSSYLLLAIPFLTHFLNDDKSLTLDAFESLCWDLIKPLLVGVVVNGKRKKQEEEEDDTEVKEEEEEQDDSVDTSNSDNFIGKLQIALVCALRFGKDDDGGSGELFRKVFKDTERICKCLLSSRIQFPDKFLELLFSYMVKLSATSQHDTPESEQPQSTFFKTLVTSIKPTQFNLLCLCVEKAVQCKIKLSDLLTKELIKMLLGVFKLKEREYTEVAKRTIQAMLLGKDFWSLMEKDEKLKCIELLFGTTEPPNLLHEYKLLHPIIKNFMLKVIGSEELGMLHGAVVEGLKGDSIGLRMCIVYLQFLGKICQCSKATDDICFEILKQLVSIAVGVEVIDIKVKDQAEGGMSSAVVEEEQKEMQSQIRKCAVETTRTILSSSYRTNVMELMSDWVSETYKNFPENPEGVKGLIKDVKKICKKIDNKHFRYVAWAYVVGVFLGDPAAAVTGLSARESLDQLIEVGKKSLVDGGGEESNLNLELVKFMVEFVVREVNPVVAYEEVFKRMLVEGTVDTDIVQVLGEFIDQGEDDDGEDIEEDSDDDDDEEEESEDDAQPPAKKRQLDEAQIAKLKASVGATEDDNDDDDEESIDLEQATAEDLKRMDESLAKVFGLKKSLKEEQKNNERVTMRVLKLIDLYVSRCSKCMDAGCLLMLLMPTVHLLRRSYKNSELCTRVISVLDGVNRVKKFSGVEMVAEGTLASIAEELWEMGKEKKHRVVKELLEQCVVTVSKCFLMGGTKNKKEAKRFLKIYFDAVDTAAGKLKRRKKRKVVVVVKGATTPPLPEFTTCTSRFVRVALEAFGGGVWDEGRDKIVERIKKGVAGGNSNNAVAGR